MQAATAADTPLQQIGAQLRAQLDKSTLPQRAGDVVLQEIEQVKRFYALRAYQPAWLNSTGPTPLADALLAAVRGAEREGLRAQDYHKNAISDAITILRTTPTLSLRQWSNFELLLTDGFLHYARHLLAGRLDPKQLDRHWPLPPRSRDLAQLLQQAIADADINLALESLVPVHPEYARLRTVLYYYRLLAENGGWPQITPGEKLIMGMRDPRVPELRTRLLATDDFPRLPKTAVAGADDDPEYFDETLHQSVRRFQLRHGLADDGVVGPRTLEALNSSASQRVRQIELNMERWRWQPDDLGARHIMVNIPNFEMTVVENGKPVLQSRAVVGRASRPTPVLSDTMSYLVFNPYWHVPRTIAVEDKLPQLRRDPYSLRRQGIRVFDAASGSEIDPAGVDWSQVSRANFRYAMRQDPGPNNALGRVKFMFPNRHAVYLHDTPTEHLFNRSLRTYSSGCVRISNPVELAEYLLKSDPAWNRQRILAMRKGNRERTVHLPETIAVHLMYWTAWADENGTVHFRSDIYQRDEFMARVFYPI